MDKIFLKHNKNWGLDESRVERISRKVVKKFKFENKIELSISFVGKKGAKDLNIRYRQMGYIPQVLGFPNSRIQDPDGYTRLGDVVICTDKLKEETRLKGNKNRDVYEILTEWIEHGVNNLFK